MLQIQKFLNLITALFGTICHLNPRGHYPNNFRPELNNGEMFDFIIVGGGSAGCVVAARLSENPNWKVLLIEAGGYPTVQTEIPLTSVALVNSELDWKYELEPSSNSCLGYKNNRCGLPRGKVLGGTGNINGMAYLRSPEEDYNRWSEMGNIGWDWKNVSQYFKKAENSINQHGDYGRNGPITLTSFKSKNIISSLLSKSIKEAGFTINANEQNLGLFEYIYNIEHGTRCSSAKGYISKNKKRKNLYIVLGVRATKVIIKDNAAVGVEVYIGGKSYNITSIKEIILSAGVIGSPKLLMLSGIGPMKHLNDLGITVVKNLPVGKNYHDHLSLRIFSKMEFQSKKSDFSLKDPLLYCIKREGFLSIDYHINLMLSHNINRTSSDPDIHLQFINFPKNINQIFLKELLENSWLYKSTTARTIIEYVSRYEVVVYAIFLGMPKFRGQILLRSKYPNDNPLIYPHLLSDETGEDIKKLKEGIKIIKNILDTPTMRIYKAELLRLNPENCKSLEFDSDEFWECYIRAFASLYYHSVGTCKMGPVSDPTTVVDPRLKVHGIDNLRVIDGSIMPIVVNRNTNAPIIMIGEKGADMIKHDNT